MDSPEKLQRGESDFYTMEVKKKKWLLQLLRLLR
jgi:hypothetical protein